MSDDLRKRATRIVEMIDDPLEEFDGSHKVMSQYIAKLEAVAEAVSDMRFEGLSWGAQGWLGIEEIKALRDALKEAGWGGE